MKCACVFEDREILDSRPPRLIEPCGYHAAMARDGRAPQYPMNHEWHVAINRFHDEERKAGRERRSWMYEAKDVAAEVPRMVVVLRQEREGKLAKVHQQCSHSATEPVEDNHLTCCLGVECRKCPELLALEKATMKPEEIDVAKAWTCAVHILSKGGDVMKEGYLLTVGDRMYWSRVYESLSQQEPPTAPPSTRNTHGTR